MGNLKKWDSYFTLYKIYGHSKGLPLEEGTSNCESIVLIFEPELAPMLIIFQSTKFVPNQTLPFRLQMSWKAFLPKRHWAKSRYFDVSLLNLGVIFPFMLEFFHNSYRNFDPLYWRYPKNLNRTDQYPKDTSSQKKEKCSNFRVFSRSEKRYLWLLEMLYFCLRATWENIDWNGPYWNVGSN